MIVEPQMNIDPLNCRPPEPVATLTVDAMWFRAATEQHAVAQRGQGAIERALQSVQKLQHKWDTLHDSSAAMDALEPIAIQLEGREYDLALAYAPVVAALASVHILAAASAEAHINILAEAELRGKMWESFERMAADTKWLFFPRITGYGAFDPGARPFQLLTILFARRNTLIHYKPKREPWHAPGVPTFLEGLGLSLQAAEESLLAVRTAVKELSQLMKREAPFWLTKPTLGGFFEIEFSDK